MACSISIQQYEASASRYNILIKRAGKKEPADQVLSCQQHPATGPDDNISYYPVNMWNYKSIK